MFISLIKIRNGKTCKRIGNYSKKHSSLGNRKVVIMYTCMYFCMHASREKESIVSSTNEHMQLKEIEIFQRSRKYFRRRKYILKCKIPHKVFANFYREKNISIFYRNILIIFK